MWFLDWVTMETHVASRLDIWRIRVVSNTRVASRLDVWSLDLENTCGL